MRVKNGSVQLLVAAKIPLSHAEKLQGVETSLTGFSTEKYVECEFTYGRVFGSKFMGHDTFAYLLPPAALEVA